MEIFVFFMQDDEDFLQKWQKVFLQLALQGSQPPQPLLTIMRGLQPLPQTPFPLQSPLKKWLFFSGLLSRKGA